MDNTLKELLKLQKEGTDVGIYSACSANEFVIEAVLLRAKETNTIALIEATANQSNQFGGYTGMKPDQFRDFVYEIAKKIDFDIANLHLGGDHLGPLTWTDKPEEEAMKLAEDLIYAYVFAGFTKIHIDTSMKLADDPEGLLSNDVIARRSAQLAKVAKIAYEDLKEKNPNAIKPVFIVGSEVPIPGGAQDEDEMVVTDPKEFVETIEVFENYYHQNDLADIWEDVIAVVVQPGVEFSDDEIDEYDREAAKGLTSELKNHNFIFEGHSTDYQTKEHLKQMVEDGIAILKVGPGLTFYMREALFSLAMMEDLLIPKSNRSNLIDVLENEMLSDPSNWEKHYHGTEQELFIKRKFSYSDRIRYYMPLESVQESVDTLFENLSEVEIPLSLLSQFMPIQYQLVREGKIDNNPRALVISRLSNLIDDYLYATNQQLLNKEVK